MCHYSRLIVIIANKLLSIQPIQRARRIRPRSKDSEWLT